MLERHILRKLYRRRCIGGKHTAIETCFTGIPKHEIKQAKKIAQELIQQELILEKKTHYGLHVSLNPERLQYIKKMLKK